MNTLLAKLRSWSGFRVLLIGDFMLDEHVHGAAERLSPDAPVPVLLASRREKLPGGSSNVAMCIRALGGDVIALGVTGDDLEGKALREGLTDGGVDVAGLLVDPSRPTTTKQSLIGLAQHRHPQKMFRVDVESKEPLSDTIAARLLAAVDMHLPDVDIVAIEDYAKGVCTPEVCQAVIAKARAAGKEVLVDPASIDDYTRYSGATAITPNRSEVERATGMDTPLEADDLHNAGLAAALGKTLDLEAVVLTLDRHGALLEERGGKPVLIPTEVRHVYDVTGAGDMVLAALLAGRANGLDWYDSVVLANAAAGLEVEVFGVQPIPFEQVHREVLRLQLKPGDKVRTLEELLVEVKGHRAAGARIVFTNGCFDVIHAGHVGYLREAAQQGDLLIVAINDDAQVGRLKGPGRPVYPEADRLAVITELTCVNYAIVFAEPTAHELLRAIKPDVYVKGGDYAPEEINEYDVVQELGIELKLLANRPGLGSTQVIEQLRTTGDQAG